MAEISVEEMLRRSGFGPTETTMRVNAAFDAAKAAPQKAQIKPKRTIDGTSTQASTNVRKAKQT